jgi:hypothetical protein
LFKKETLIYPSEIATLPEIVIALTLQCMALLKTKNSKRYLLIICLIAASQIDRYNVDLLNLLDAIKEVKTNLTTEANEVIEITSTRNCWM